MFSAADVEAAAGRGRLLRPLLRPDRAGLCDHPPTTSPEESTVTQHAPQSRPWDGEEDAPSSSGAGDAQCGGIVVHRIFQLTDIHLHKDPSRLHPGHCLPTDPRWATVEARNETPEAFWARVQVQDGELVDRACDGTIQPLAATMA
jgi:hypothetical protein